MLGNRSRSVTGSRMRLFRTYKITGSLLKELPGCTSPRASVFQDRALHEHRRPSSLPSHTSFKVACFSSFGMAPVLVPLRPSNEHILIVRVPRAQETNGLLFPPLTPTPRKRILSAKSCECYTAPRAIGLTQNPRRGFRLTRGLKSWLLPCSCYLFPYRTRIMPGLFPTLHLLSECPRPKLSRAMNYSESARSMIISITFLKR